MTTAEPHAAWVASRLRTLALDRPRILAIINLTPDSFSDGGQHQTPASAAHAAASACEQGAAALDLGGESTRPGAREVSAAEQIARVIPALDAIRRAVPDTTPITIDTMNAEVAAAAFDHGADAINDVSGATADPRMLALAAARGAGIILMHRLRPPARDAYSDRYVAPPQYGPDGVVAVVREHLAGRARAAIDAGIPRERIMLDPGLGFGKTVEQNVDLIMRTSEIAALGFPILSGLSRKSFTARVGGLAPDAAPRDRLMPTLALSVLHLACGARLFRVHDVGAHAQALAAAWAALARSAAISDAGQAQQ